MTTTQPAALPEPLGWYVVNNIGMATLCKDEADAQLLAEDCDMVYQRQAPHRAVQLVALRPQADTLCFELSAMLGCPPSDTDVVACVSSLLTPRPQAVPMTEADLLACVVKANCLGGVPMSNRNGHYHIDTPSDAVVRLKDAIESHHGITAPAGGVLHAAHQPAKEPSK